MAFILNEVQKRNMVEIYLRNGRKMNGVWTYSLRDAFEDYHEVFPNEAIPYDHFCRSVSRFVNLFRETGSVNRKEGSGGRVVRTEETIEAVRQVMEERPQTSVRHLQQEVHLSYGTCRNILKKDLHCHPYRLQVVHEILPPDRPRRQEFAQQFIDRFQNNNAAFEKIMFTDESWFHLSGYVNSQNMRMWCSDNPHFFTETPLHPQKIGVWAAISRRRIIGPIFFEGTLNAERYRLEILTPFVNMLHDDELQQGCFQQDGARIHTTFENITFLRQFFGDRIISLNTETIWPPRSCDITPCDFFLWPHLKNTIFKTPVADLGDLQQRIINTIEEINNTPWILHNVIDSVKRRVTLCRDVGGGHITHLL